MLDDIRFTMAAVAKKAYAPELTHFVIKNGRITGFNGQLTLSSTIGVDLDVRPNAAKFLAAVRACQGTISLHVTDAGRLAVRAGRFKAFVDCLPDESHLAGEPSGESVELSDIFYHGIRLLSPLMGIDASRPWAMGIKVFENCMYATNNVMVGQFWHGCPFPYDVVIPSAAIDELLRIGTAPTRVQVCPNTVTFWFGDDRYLRTTLLDGGAWPLQQLDGALDAAPGVDQVAFSPTFFEDVASLKPFLAEDPAVYLRPGSVSTSRHEGDGASVEVEVGPVGELQCYSFKQLELLGQVATAIDWRNYPKPCMFTHAGEPLRGLIIGRRL